MHARRPKPRLLLRADSLAIMATALSKSHSHPATHRRTTQCRTLLGGLLLAVALLGVGCGNQVVAGGNARAVVQEKVKRIEARFPAWVAAGGDASRIEPLGKELDVPMRAGRYEEAE